MMPAAARCRPGTSWLTVCPRRLDAPLPAGVRVKGDTLLFQRPLAAADAGDYVCRVANRVAAKEARANVSIKSRAAGGRPAGSVRPSVRPSVGAAFLPHPF